MAATAQFNELGSDPAAAVTGHLALYAKTDGILYTINDAGTVTPVGGGGGGTPGGNNTNVQFNNSGTFDGSDDLNFSVGFGSGSLFVGGNSGSGKLWFANSILFTGTPSSAGWAAFGVTDFTYDNFNITVNTPGLGFRIKTGTNARAGFGTLTAGTATISNTTITANSIVLPVITTLGTVTVPQAVSVVNNVGSDFTVTSADPTDTSSFSYLIVELVP